VKLLYWRFVLPTLYLAHFFLLPADSFAEVSLQYSRNMDTNPGWSTEGLWAYGKPEGKGGEYGGPDPSSGFTGDNVYGYNLSGDYVINLPELHLTTEAINCSDLSQVKLKFWRWLGVEDSFYGLGDYAFIRVSNDGIVWTTVWENPAIGPVEDTSWIQQEVDISPVANCKSTVYIRWTMGTTDGLYNYCGWNIDDVEIWAESSVMRPCPECSDNVSLIENVTFPACKTCECIASTPITIGSGVVFETGANVTVKAPKVSLKPGFHTPSNARVNIRQP